MKYYRRNRSGLSQHRYALVGFRLFSPSQGRQYLNAQPIRIKKTIVLSRLLPLLPCQMSLRRAKRAKTSGTSDRAPASPNQSNSNDNNAVTGDVDNRKCKFVELPLELLLEIISHFQAVSIPAKLGSEMPVLPPSVFERPDVLRALSQTCRHWRSIFFPMLWERMEVCAVRAKHVRSQNATSQVVAPQQALAGEPKPTPD